MEGCGHTECPTHGIGIARNGHGLAFEKPIEVYLHLTIDGEQRAVFVGRAYQNPHGYFAQTDAGIMPAKDIEDALELINRYIDMDGRGLRRIDPPAAVVQKDSPTGQHKDCNMCESPVLRGIPHDAPIEAPVDEDKTKRVYEAVNPPLQSHGVEPVEEDPDIDLWISFIIGKEGKG